MSENVQSDTPQQNPVEHLDHVTIGNTTTQEFLSVIKEENSSPAESSTRMVASKATSDDLRKDLIRCVCKEEEDDSKTKKINAEEIERLLKEKETELRSEYDKILEREKALMKERFDYIMLNEQTRASFMLREAHRERQEKITALQSQLECKNLAALMYVMCTERTRSKFEKKKIIKEYTSYIHELQDILTEGQELILHLSRGYKTAARVDHEWRQKMKKVVNEFLTFIYQFAGGNPDTNQYFLDLPALLKIETPTVDDPEENPCEEEEEEEEEGTEEIPSTEIPREKSWWEELDGENRPFVLFGDLAEFDPVQRRHVLKTIKARKTAPKKWKRYAFNNMFLNSACPHLTEMSEFHPLRLPVTCKFECMNGVTVNSEFKEKTPSRQSLIPPRKAPTQSIDFRGNMGSLLKIITSTQVNSTAVPTKTALLGARDSMEIASTTKLREGTSLRLSQEKHETEESKEVVLAIGKKRASVFEAPDPVETPETPVQESTTRQNLEEDSATIVGSFNDSLEVIQLQNHVTNKDDKINYERVCPMEECQRLQMDSFMRSLPPYMRANPFTHFQETFDEYETCTPEQIEMLKQRIENKKTKDDEEGDSGVESPLMEWIGRGVAVQTSDQSLSLPPCTCHVPSPTPVSSNFIFNLEDLMPVKLAMNAIHKECLYDDRIEFDRFKVIGQDSTDTLPEKPKKEFQQARQHEITNILKNHPSLLDIFQANTHS